MIPIGLLAFNTGPFGETSGTDRLMDKPSLNRSRRSVRIDNREDYRGGNSDQYVQPSNEYIQASPPRRETPTLRLITPSNQNRIVFPTYQLDLERFRNIRAIPSCDIFSEETKRKQKSFKYLPVFGDGHRPYWDQQPINSETYRIYRQGLVPLVNMIEAVARGVYEKTHQPLFVNDLNAMVGHRSHREGKSADILVRLKGGYPSEGGPLKKFKGLSQICGGEFTEGENYDRDETFAVMEKFLDYRDTILMIEDEIDGKPFLRPWDSNKDWETPKWYKIKVKKLITSDQALYERLRGLYGGRRILLDEKLGHNNHFHIEILLKKCEECIPPLSRSLTLWQQPPQPITFYSAPKPATTILQNQNHLKKDTPPQPSLTKSLTDFIQKINPFYWLMKLFSK